MNYFTAVMQSVLQTETGHHTRKIWNIRMYDDLREKDQATKRRIRKKQHSCLNFSLLLPNIWNRSHEDTNILIYYNFWISESSLIHPNPIDKLYAPSSSASWHCKFSRNSKPPHLFLGICPRRSPFIPICDILQPLNQIIRKSNMWISVVLLHLLPLITLSVVFPPGTESKGLTSVVSPILSLIRLNSIKSRMDAISQKKKDKWKNWKWRYLVSGDMMTYLCL